MGKKISRSKANSNFLIRGLDYLTELMYKISIFILVVMGLMITVSILLRYFFHYSVGWSTEVSEYLLYVLIMLTVPWVLKNDEHIRLDFFINYLNPKLKEKLLRFGDLLCAVFCLIFFYLSALATYTSYVEGKKILGVLKIDRYLLIFFIPLMSLVCFYQFLKKLHKTIVAGTAPTNR